MSFFSMRLYYDFVYIGDCFILKKTFMIYFVKFKFKYFKTFMTVITYHSIASNARKSSLVLS